MNREQNKILEILYNFIENERSNVECLFIIEYNAHFMNFLECNIRLFQQHASFEAFIACELKEQYHFIDLHDIKIIEEADSMRLFRKIKKDRLRIVLYNSLKKHHKDILKNCWWLRTYSI